MRRNRVGIAGLTQRQTVQERYKQQGDEISGIQLRQVQEQFVQLRENVERFAIKYKKSINKDPTFRRQFNEMCKSIGVDPLTSSIGFWAQLLGVGDFYYELAVQIVEICMQTREVNGGLIDLDLLIDLLQKKRGPTAKEISSNDIERSVAKLQVLDNYRVLTIGSRKMIQSVPVELSSDDTTVLALAQETGYVTASIIKTQLKWDNKRTEMVCLLLLKEGMAWIDYQTEDGEPQYWIVSMFQLE